MENGSGVVCISLPYRGKLIPNAKTLRREATKQENHLWYDFLKDYPIRFQRQKVIDGFIVDFYCHKAKIVVELDGSQHYSEQGRAYDVERNQILEKYDLLVVRYTNLDITQRFEAVCGDIDAIVRRRIVFKASLAEGGGTAKP